MNRIRIALVAVVATALVAPARAQTINVNSITPTWSSIAPNSTSSLDVDNSGSVVRLYWGSTRGDQSAFSFDDRTTPLNVTLSGGMARFNLGTFTHTNNEIGGTALTSARLNLLLGLTGAAPSTFSTSITFNHDETANASTCPYGSASMNWNGCADRVTLSGMTGPQQFTIGTQAYLFTLLGFSSSSSTYTPLSAVVTPERGSNTAYVWAEISKANVVPEPSTYALMATGLVGLVGLARRRTVKG